MSCLMLRVRLCPDCSDGIRPPPDFAITQSVHPRCFVMPALRSREHTWPRSICCVSFMLSARRLLSLPLRLPPPLDPLWYTHTYDMSHFVSLASFMRRLASSWLVVRARSPCRPMGSTTQLRPGDRQRQSWGRGSISCFVTTVEHAYVV